MKVNCCIIMSAGLGTRMGEIGKILPKVVWPVFEKSILDLQICWVRSFGIKNIFINTFHQVEKVKALVEAGNHKDVTLIAENPLLDSGGTIHYLLETGLIDQQESILYLAGDQFYVFDQDFFLAATKLIGKDRAVLFGLPVDDTAPYNRLLHEHDYVT